MQAHDDRNVVQASPDMKNSPQAGIRRSATQPEAPLGYDQKQSASHHPAAKAPLAVLPFGAMCGSVRL